MQYYFTVNIILVLFFLAFFYLIYNWLKKDANIKEIAYLLGFSVLVTLIFKFPFSNHFFGLEYEDAYIFNFSARQLSENIYSTSFLTDGINIGSINKPISTVTYGGHFITYPVLISWFYNTFGYNIYLPSYLNALIEFFTILTLSVFFKKIFKFKNTWAIPGLIYSIAPIMNLFGNTHLSETLSSFAVLLSIISFYYYFKKRTFLILVVFGIFFFTALLTKRENMVLFSLFFVFSSYLIFFKKKQLRVNIPPLSLAVIIIAIYLVFIQNVFLIEQIEAVEISSSTFSFNNFTNLLPVFIKALFNLKWFGIHFSLLLFSGLYIVFYKKDNAFLISVLVLYISYFAIYTFHYRSYYFIHFGKVVPFEALRYLNNFFIISTIIISLVFSQFFEKKKLLKILIPLFTILLTVSFVYTINVRKNFSIIEQEDRFNNPISVLKFLSKYDNKSTLITDNILIFQLIGNNDLNLVDINSLDDYTLSKKDKHLFLTNHNKQENYKYRHPAVVNKISAINKEEKIKFKNNDSLYKLK